MKTKKKTTHAQKNNRQWAWQFLRRNLQYRKTYEYIGTLTQDQRDTLQKLIHEVLYPYSENWAQLGALPVKLFDRKYLDNYKREDATLDDFIRDKNKASLKKKRIAQQIDAEKDDLVLRIEPMFRAGYYGLYYWLDPDVDEVSEAEANELWFYRVPIESSLIRSPEMDDKGFSFEESEWKGISVAKLLGRSEEDEPKEIPRDKDRPVKHETLPLKKGVNNAVFMMNNFATPASYHFTNGNRITIGRDPTPLSLDGDSLVQATFDVGLPIEYQLDAVKAYLVSHQKELQAGGFIDELPSRKSRQGVFESYIAILDLHEQGLSHLEIAFKLKKNLQDDSYIDAQGKKQKSFADPKNPEWATEQDHTSAIRKQLARARQLRDSGYRSLALQMD
jgi:hypothetical protein